MTWINTNTKLKGKIVDLIPLSSVHFNELSVLARDERIWEFYSYDCGNPARFRELLTISIAEKEKGKQFPFVIFHKPSARIIGSTRFLNIEENYKKLEIGWTWLLPEYWGTEINFECKLLLLTFCFENLKAIRVQLKTNEKNIRSRKAIAKIGAKFEGILRNDMIGDNGVKRNTAYFSIIDTEWNEARQIILRRLKEKDPLYA